MEPNKVNNSVLTKGKNFAHEIVVLILFLIVGGIGLVFLEGTLSKDAQKVVFICLFLTGSYCAYKRPKQQILNSQPVMLALVIISLIGLFDASKASQMPAVSVSVESGSQASAPAAVTEPASKSSLESKEFAWTDNTKEAVRRSLKDPESAEFRNVKFKRYDGTPVVCGEVNSKNGYGGFTGFQRFVASGDKLVFLEEQVADFGTVWAKMCH